MKLVRWADATLPLALTLVVILTLALSPLSVQPANADELYGRVRGIVSDATGAAVPGVQVKLTNVGTGIAQELVSASDGSFAFVNQKPGVYTLVVTKTNFKSFQVSSIKVEPNEIYVQNVISHWLDATGSRCNRHCQAL